MSNLKRWIDFEKSDLWAELKKDLENDLLAQQKQTKLDMRSYMRDKTPEAEKRLNESLNAEEIYEWFLTLVQLKINRLSASEPMEYNESEIIDIKMPDFETDN